MNAAAIFFVATEAESLATVCDSTPLAATGAGPIAAPARPPARGIVMLQAVFGVIFIGIPFLN
jgi:hypothetical protein